MASHESDNPQLRQKILVQEVWKEYGKEKISRDELVKIVRMTLEGVAHRMELWPYDTMGMLRKYR